MPNNTPEPQPPETEGQIYFVTCEIIFGNYVRTGRLEVFSCHLIDSLAAMLPLETTICRQRNLPISRALDETVAITSCTRLRSGRRSDVAYAFDGSCLPELCLPLWSTPPKSAGDE